MTHRTRGERGSISIWLAVSSFVMMMLVGLAVDLGGQVHAKQRAHNIAAEAARTGGEQVQAAPAIKGEYVAVDAVAGRVSGSLLRQRDALRNLGVSGERPDLGLATTEPAAYVRDLARASEAAELTAAGGLGDFWWVVSAVGVDSPW